MGIKFTRNHSLDSDSMSVTATWDLMGQCSKEFAYRLIEDTYNGIKKQFEEEHLKRLTEEVLANLNLSELVEVLRQRIGDELMVQLFQQRVK